MNNGDKEMVHRVLVIDDNPDIHKDFQTILIDEKQSAELETLRAEVFDDKTGKSPHKSTYELDFASQGKEGSEKIKQALSEDRPYALVFVDMRMPPGWNGLETIEHIWKTDPNIEVVICTAYSDYSREEITKRLGKSENLLMLKKPFDSAEVAQLASALTEKWVLARRASMKMEQLEQMAKERTEQLTKSNELLEQEVAEHKRAKEALQDSEERFRLFFENEPEYCYIISPEGIILDVNIAALKALGYNKDELIGQSLKTIYAPESLPKTKEIFARWKETGIVTDEELEIITKNGERRTILLSASVIRDKDGKIIQSVSVQRDITERKQTQEKQAELLRQIESINRELRDFASIVSHDLKAPLRGIKTLASWISTDYADKLDEDGREQMNLLSGRVDWMHQLIEGVLEYSRVGRIKEEWVQMNLNEVVAKVIDILAPPENIAITIEDALPTIEYEPTRIAQVFQNLLSNAMKYMDKPNGQIKVGCAEDNGFWKFSVADNGSGIEEKHFEKIFHIFQTLSPRNESESTGVGLTITKKIVELDGGKIWVESKVGEGSTFYFTLPKQKRGTKNAKLAANTVS
ncbi:MAG: PAS domain S-box protein [Planctomycetota bacterium]|jgi:PAS domain S-box-containing protein